MHNSENLLYLSVFDAMSPKPDKITLLALNSVTENSHDYEGSKSVRGPNNKH